MRVVASSTAWLLLPSLRCWAGRLMQQSKLQASSLTTGRCCHACNTFQLRAGKGCWPGQMQPCC